MRLPLLILSALVGAACQGGAPVVSAPPGSHLLVLGKEDATLRLVNPSTGVVLREVETGVGPHEVAVSYDGRLAVVANYGAESPGSTLTVYDVVGRRHLPAIDLAPHGRPHGIQFLDNRTRVLVTAETSDAVLQVHVASGEVERVLPVGGTLPHMLTISRARDRVYTTNLRSGDVSMVDLDDGEVLARTPVGDEPEAIALRPDGRELWVGCRRSGELVVLDPDGLSVIERLPCPGMPIRLAFTPDGGTALATLHAEGALSVWDVAARRERARVPLPSVEGAPEPRPIGVQVDPRGGHAFVADGAGGRVHVLELASDTFTTSFDAGRGPDGMAWSYTPRLRVTPGLQDAD